MHYNCPYTKPSISRHLIGLILLNFTYFYLNLLCYTLFTTYLSFLRKNILFWSLLVVAGLPEQRV